MARLGQFLRQRRLITNEQLEEALAHQAVQGARLGTNLVELGFITLDKLGVCLSELHNVPLPPRKWLEKPQRTAAQRVTRPLVERIRFVPMRLDGKVLHAAVLDPRHPNVLDDLRFATGCRIQPYVLPEIWMHDWLLQLFAIPRGIRQVVAPGQHHDPGRNDETVPDFNPGMAGAPAMFESTAMANAQAASAAAAAATRGTRPMPARVPTQPMGAREQRVSAAQPQRQQPLSVPPTVQIPMPKGPATLPRLADPNPPRESLQPPPPRARVRPPLSAIEQTSWTTLQGTPPLTQPAAHAAPGAAAWPLFPPSKPPPPPVSKPPPPPVSKPPPPPPPAAEPPPEPIHSSGPPPLPEAEEDPSVELIPAAPVPELERVAMARELSEWEHALQQVADRDRLIELVLSIAGCFAERVALFSVNQGTVQGVRCVERGVARPVDGVLLTLDVACMLTEVATRRDGARFDPRARPMDLRVAELLSDAEATDVALLPVAIKQRVVNVLYASNGPAPIGPVAYGALQLIAQEMGAGYGRIILARKAGSS